CCWIQLRIALWVRRVIDHHEVRRTRPAGSLVSTVEGDTTKSRL
ncbi:hypothetical protein NPIL_63961, partial [Nephila pilipes]